MSQEPWAELAEAIRAIRSELKKAMELGAGETVRFRTGPVEMEFAIDVKKDAEARAKIMVLPWSAEAKGAVASSRTSKVKIVLHPVDEDGTDLSINARSDTRPE
ncbi:trypco2 family protein [Actinophytocola sp.]|uniref:trypco2 family protein n=1 Tax=Actinophytocola sp. TaxID=1872138 RepID=UPI002ED0FD32